MTSKKRKAMMSSGLKNLIPKPSFWQQMPDVGQGMPFMLCLLQESLEHDARIICL